MRVYVHTHTHTHVASRAKYYKLYKIEHVLTMVRSERSQTNNMALAVVLCNHYMLLVVVLLKKRLQRHLRASDGLECQNDRMQGYPQGYSQGTTRIPPGYPQGILGVSPEYPRGTPPGYPQGTTRVSQGYLWSTPGVPPSIDQTYQTYQTYEHKIIIEMSKTLLV